LDIQQGSVGEVFGSAHYIAPEQARRSSDAVPQSDIYSLGIILYEMLTGVVPFDDPSPTAVAIQHITQPPPAPRTINANLSQAVEDVLLKALNKSANERYQTGAELIAALEEAIQNNSTTDQAVPLPLPPAGMSMPSQPERSSQLNVPQQKAVSQPSPKKLSPDESLLRQKKTPRTKAPAESQPARSRRPNYLWLGVGGCGLIFVIIAVIAGVLFRSSLSPLSSATTIPLASTAPETLTLAATSSLATSSSTDTISIVGTPAADTVPTVKYPNGKRFMLFYDDNSFYFYNLSDASIPINWVAFERLNDAGVVLNRFDGSQWAKFYGSSEPLRCMALKILGSSSYLEPPECGTNNFLSLRTPVRDDPMVFWTSMEGSHQFRVLWREGGTDEEVARCEIGVQTCEVFLP